MLNSLRVQYNREPKINIKIKYLTQSHKKNVWANILWEWPTSHEQTKTFIYDSTPKAMSIHIYIFEFTNVWTQYVWMHIHNWLNLKTQKTHKQITWKMFKQTIYDSDPQSMNTDTNIYIWYPHQYFLQSYTIISFIRPIDQAYRSIIMHKSSSTEC